MQSEIIYLVNTKILTIKNKGRCYQGIIEGVEKTFTNLEPLGRPFSIITKSNKNIPLEETLEFKELYNPFTPLEHYLREAEVEFTLSRREKNLPQYLGIEYGNPAIMEVINNFGRDGSNIKRSIFPCKFYLIKDKF
ncbi:MAG TPA: hypothetical protein PK357_00405 [Candidatus Pacearchaeota archaeon]|nr:hypothetical protein [Candidatus Pacearchaeota archaeon]